MKHPKKRRAHNSTLPAGEKPLRRKTAMPKPSKPMAKRNGKRLAKRRAQDFGPKAEWITTLPCEACRVRKGVDPHHARTRGAGGHAEALVPLCRGCHGLVHQVGVESFRLATGVDLRDAAVRLEMEWQAMNATSEAA